MEALSYYTGHVVHGSIVLLHRTRGAWKHCPTTQDTWCMEALSYYTGHVVHGSIVLLHRTRGARKHCPTTQDTWCMEALSYYTGHVVHGYYTGHVRHVFDLLVSTVHIESIQTLLLRHPVAVSCLG